MTIPKMRSITETAKYFKELDPQTEITEYTLRKLISEDSIPYVKTGVKYLLNVDLLIDIFSQNPGVQKLGSSPMNQLCIEK